MKTANEQLIEEIKQLHQQYLAEIGDGGRKPWPKSIKDRVLMLCEQGVPAMEVSQLTGISYHSVLPWRKKAGFVRDKAKGKKRSKFHTLTVTDLVPVEAENNLKEPATRAVTVQVPGIGSIELPDVKSAAELIWRLKQMGGGSHAV